MPSRDSIRNVDTSGVRTQEAGATSPGCGLLSGLQFPIHQGGIQDTHSAGCWHHSPDRLSPVTPSRSCSCVWSPCPGLWGPRAKPAFRCSPALGEAPGRNFYGMSASLRVVLSGELVAPDIAQLCRRMDPVPAAGNLEVQLPVGSASRDRSASESWELSS